MPKSLQIDDQTAEILSPQTLTWFHQSELATDPETARVVDHLDTLYSAPGLTLSDDVLFALAAAYFHRATATATVDGNPITTPDEIPGDLDSITLNILKGYSTRAAHKKNCLEGEEQVGAAILHMATRWVQGKKAPKWTFDVIQRTYGDSTYCPEEVTFLEEFEHSFLKALA